MFEDSVINFADNIYLWEKSNNHFQGTTYKQTRDRVHTFAAGLMKLGLNCGDRVTLLAEGRNDWVISELGVLYCGAINVPLSIKLNEPEEISFRLQHSGSKMAIVSKRQIQKVLDVADNIPSLETIICLDKIDLKDKRVVLAETIIEQGIEFLKTNSVEFIQRFQF